MRARTTQNQSLAVHTRRSLVCTESTAPLLPADNSVATMSSTTTSLQAPVCPDCGCKKTVKKGKRRNRLQILQVFRCTECLHRFTGTPGKNKTYPFRLVIETLSTFNLGNSLTETQTMLRRRFHREIPERTISSWLTEYRLLTCNWT